MPPEIAALIDKPILLAAVLFAGAMIGIYLEKFATWERRRKWREKNGARRNGKVLPFQPKPDPVPRQALDAADQLRTVMNAEFKPQRLLNKSEARLFKAMDKMVLSLRPDWQVMAQVSLGEILRTEDKAAYGCINAKRVDLRSENQHRLGDGAFSSSSTRNAARCTRSSTRAAGTSRALTRRRQGTPSKRKRCGGRGSAMSRWSAAR